MHAKSGVTSLAISGVGYDSEVVVVVVVGSGLMERGEHGGHLGGRNDGAAAALPTKRAKMMVPAEENLMLFLDGR